MTNEYAKLQAQQNALLDFEKVRHFKLDDLEWLWDYLEMDMLILEVKEMLK